MWIANYRKPTKMVRLLKLCLFFGLGVILLGTEQAPRPVTLAFTGDVMLGRGVARAHSNGNWDDAMAAIQPALASADLALANLESPLSTIPVSTTSTDQQAHLNLCAAAKNVVALSASGLDLVFIVNNHDQDCGAAGKQNSHLALQAQGLMTIGQKGGVFYRTINGTKLAFLAYEDVTAPIDITGAVQAIQEARASGAVVVVSVHWGWEYQTAPNPRQTGLVQEFADAGATVVWGHHPHVLQRVAWLQGAGQTQPTLVAFSLGNALFDQLYPLDTRRGAVLLVTLDQNGIRSIRVSPFEIDPLKGKDIPASEKASSAILERLGPIATPTAFTTSSQDK